MDTLSKLSNTIQSLVQINQVTLINSTLKNSYNKSIDFYDKIDAKYNAVNCSVPNDSNIDNTFKKFVQYQANEILSSAFKIKEIRAITYNLNYSLNDKVTILSNEKYFTTLIELLEDEWKYSYLKGLFRSGLRFWNYEYSYAVLNYVKFKIDQYTGNTIGLINIKNVINFFSEDDGVDKLISTVVSKKVPLKQLSSYLNIHRDLLHSSYFKKFLERYLEHLCTHNLLTIDHLYDLKEFLILHNNEYTNKVVLPLLIKDYQNVDSEHFELIRDITFNIIGDSGNSYKWSPLLEMNDTERESLNNARNILNKWLINKFINIFFEICINDIARKEFWLNYVDYISDFKIYGSAPIKQLLFEDDRIKDFIESRFVLVSDKQPKSAFLMQINNYSLIEFADSANAFYAYTNNGRFIELIKNGVPKLEYLKFTGLPSLLENKFADNGKLIHRGDWQKNFNDFLRRKVL